MRSRVGRRYVCAARRPRGLEVVRGLGWLYRFIVDSLLGLRFDSDKLHFAPYVPASGHSLQVHYRHREALYHITVRQTLIADSGPSVTVDCVELPGPTIPTDDDRRQHMVEARIFAARS